MQKASPVLLAGLFRFGLTGLPKSAGRCDPHSTLPFWAIVLGR